MRCAGTVGGTFVRGAHAVREWERESDKRRGREKSTARWRGSLVYHTSGGVAREGWGYSLGERRRRGSGQVSRRVDTSGADLRVFESSGYTIHGRAAQRHCCYTIPSCYACYGRVASSSSSSPSSSLRRGVTTFGGRSGCIFVADHAAGCISLAGLSGPFLPHAEGAIASEGWFHVARIWEGCFLRAHFSEHLVATFARVHATPADVLTNYEANSSWR